MPEPSGSFTHTVPGCTILVTVKGRKIDLNLDACKGALAVGEWLRTQSNCAVFAEYRHLYAFGDSLEPMRQEYSRAMDREDYDAAGNTLYGKLLTLVEDVATKEITKRWHNPKKAVVTVDIRPLSKL